MTPEQSSFALAMLLKPFVALAVFFLLAVLVRRPLERRMKDGRLKRILLKRLS
jgi:4-amino-4-deoxy-L-arabinose transferase-like glycosyltransferase